MITWEWRRGGGGGWHDLKQFKHLQWSLISSNQLGANKSGLIYRGFEKSRIKLKWYTRPSSGTRPCARDNEIRITEADGIHRPNAVQKDKLFSFNPNDALRNCRYPPPPFSAFHFTPLPFSAKTDTENNGNRLPLRLCMYKNFHFLHVI